MEEKKKKLRLQKTPLIIAAVLIMTGVVAGYFIYKNRSDDTKQSVSGEWVEYKNEKYGFKFDYSKEWGNPQLKLEESVPITGMIKSSKQAGLRYTINFPELEAEKLSFVEIKFTSNNYTNTICVADNQCATDLAVTEDTMRVNLARARKDIFLRYDLSSYSTLSYRPPLGVLTIHQVVKLPKINVSAAIATYSLTSSDEGCKDGEFSKSKKCITEADYIRLNRLIKSFSPL